MAPRPADNAQALRKQRAAIEAIAADNMKLKEELMLENKFSVNPTTQTAAALIANLQQQADAYAKKITEEQQLKAELEHQVQLMQEKIADQRVQMGGIHASAEQSRAVQRRIKTLEDRVQQASVRYNEALTRNRRLRDRVDSLRRERLLFEDLQRKMMRAVARRRQEITDLIGAISDLHEAREKAVILRGQVKVQAESNVANCEAEWRKLTEMIEHDRKSRELARQREVQAREQQMAALFKQDFSLAKRRSTVARGPGGSGSSASGAGRAGTGADSPLPAPERVTQLDEAFEKIKADTGSASIEELLESLVAAEEANFSLFTYVNDLNAEIEKLEDQIGGVRAEIDRYRSEAASKANDSHSCLLRELEQTLARTEAKAEAYEEKHEGALRTVSALREAVLDMFSRAGCDTEAVRQLLGDGGVTEANIMQYLGIVEQRTNEVLASYFALASDDREVAAERTAAVMTAGARRTGSAPPPEYVIEPPSTTPGGAVGTGPGEATGGGQAAAAGTGSRTVAGGGAGYRPSGEGGAEDDLPLDRAALEARVQRMVATKAEHAIKIKAVRPAGSGGK